MKTAYAGAVDSPSWARDGGKVPDYVFGTDARKLADQAAGAPAPIAMQVSYAGPPASDEVPPLRLEDLMAAAPDNAGAPDVDADAPPEAAGDIRPAP